MGRFVPRSKRGTAAAEDHLALFSGVPEHMRSALFDWTRLACSTYYLGGMQPSRAYLHSLELELQLPLGILPPEERFNQLAAKLFTDQSLWLDVVDYMIRRPCRIPDAGKQAAELSSLLTMAGSAWMVVPDPEHGFFMLIERVPEAVSTAVESAATPGTAADHHLKTAWVQAYGRSPSPGESYREAIKAVEAAAIPVVEPNNHKATLGTVLGYLGTTSGRWATTAPATEPLVVEMMKALWSQQVGRHGAAGPGSPPAHTPEEAKAAVHLAATLVQWFHSGAFRRP